MATIGHALVGLTLGEICPENARANKLPNAWFGLMVAAAFLVDFAEWVALFFVPPDHDKHFITHSPLIAGAIATSLIILTFIFTRMRSPWPYLLIAIAVMSHLPLDHKEGRALLAVAYGFDGNSANYIDGAFAEAWLYGLLFVETTIIIALRDPRVPPKARKAALILAILAAAAAATRQIWIWSPVYLLALIHIALIYRSKLNRKLLWSLVPLVPLLAVPITQGAAGFLTHRAITMRESGDNLGALSLNEFILAMPTRKSFVTNYIEVSRCNDALSNPAASELALQNAAKAAHDYGTLWPRFFLAMFYMNEKWRGTAYYQPEKSEQILRSLLQETNDPEQQHHATEALEVLKKRRESN